MAQSEHAKIHFSANQWAPRSLTQDERVQLLRLARTENVGPISFFHLLGRFGSASEVLDRLPSLVRRGAPRIPAMEDLWREIDAHHQRGLSLLSIFDAEYPSALRALKDPPPFISLCGRPELLTRTVLAVVGSRNASAAGERVASEIVGALSERGWVMVSGLARGIDGCVHRASLEGGGTAAVIAGGLGHIYPPEHKALYAQIAEQGVILSEDPLFQSPQASLFAKRNRLISGLAWGALVIEASAKSGSLLTAKYAADQGRAVMALPGHPLDFRARGGNRLIKQGACLVETADDVLQEYASSHRHLAFEPDALAFDEDPLGLPPSLMGMAGFVDFGLIKDKGAIDRDALANPCVAKTDAIGPGIRLADTSKGVLTTLGAFGRAFANKNRPSDHQGDGEGFDAAECEGADQDPVDFHSGTDVRAAIDETAVQAQGPDGDRGAKDRLDPISGIEPAGQCTEALGQHGQQANGPEGLYLRVLDVLNPSVPTSIEEISVLLSVPASWVRVCLVQLELSGDILWWPADGVSLRV
jgi:DNA processing protein